jgi:hypothetical protein
MELFRSSRTLITTKGNQIMKNLFYFCLFVLFSNMANAQVVDNRVHGPTKVVTSSKPVPMDRPQANKQVAVVTLSFDFVDGKVQSARKLSSKRIQAYAPKVFARQSGDWEVLIRGAGDHRFYIANPGYREAEPHSSSNDKYEWIGVTGRVELPLIVPLYHKEETLQVSTITIKDTRTGEIILETSI